MFKRSIRSLYKYYNPVNYRLNKIYRHVENLNTQKAINNIIKLKKLLRNAYLFEDIYKYIEVSRLDYNTTICFMDILSKSSVFPSLRDACLRDCRDRINYLDTKEKINE